MTWAKPMESIRHSGLILKIIGILQAEQYDNFLICSPSPVPAQKHISGLDASLLIQVIGAVTTFLYSAIISVVILFVINKVIGLRVDAEQEQIGLDLAQHGEHVP